MQDPVRIINVRTDFCDCMVHPFQKDPGVSQHQRVMDELLSESPKIDARQLADLLDYFQQLSRHLNYYDSNLNVSDWQPFFEKSIPFAIASLIKFKPDAINDNFEFYNALFTKNPSAKGLQVAMLFIFYNTIKKINDWHLKIKGNDLPLERDLENIIKDKLQQPLKDFICLNNVASKYYCIKRIDYSKFLSNGVWNLSAEDIAESTSCININLSGKRKRLVDLQDKIKKLFPSFLEAIKILMTNAERSLELSLLPLKEELKELHSPHLGLLFAFLKLFEKLQDDLNTFTKKHLEFFYKQVLKLKPKEAVPDKAHIVFEIQKELKNYLLEKGIKVKDGKDINKQEIFFSSDDDILVTKAQVKDIRTLYLNNQLIPDPANPSGHVALLEGVYMAPDATKADGIDEDFQTEVKNFYTVGNKESKYITPETKLVKEYPHSRLGFILASPVLLLNEGNRIINISLMLKLDDPVCIDGIYNKTFSAKSLYDRVSKTIQKKFYFVSEELLKDAVKNGLSNNLAEKIRKQYLQKKRRSACCDEIIITRKDNVEVSQLKWNLFFNTSEREILENYFKLSSPLNILFSGEKEWLEPSSVNVRFEPFSGMPAEFKLLITATFEADKPAITFYDKDKLKEDFATTLPLVKIELDDRIRTAITWRKQESDCCLERVPDDINLSVASLYHFFRNVKIINAIGPDQSRIDITVCGLKNFIVQNDESVMDVNSPFALFGTRPVIRNFDIYNLPLVHDQLTEGPNFYIGSKEIFCKNWVHVRINYNWKDKPDDFNEYYKGYVLQDEASQLFGLNDDEFKIRISVLQDGNWNAEGANRVLFDLSPLPSLPQLSAMTSPCDHDGIYKKAILISVTDFDHQDFCIDIPGFKKLDVNSRNGFIKLNLREQDFLHKDYAFVLSRQMMALGRYPDALLEGAVYKTDGNTVIVFRSLGKRIVDLKNDIVATQGSTQSTVNKVTDLNTTFDAAINWDGVNPNSSINNSERNTLIPLVHDSLTRATDSKDKANLTKDHLDDLQSVVDIFDPFTGEIVKPLTVLIPNEPWTPMISNMALDYTATATLQDITLIHVYPYEGTYKHEEIELQPTLFPTFCDEGTLFLGLENLIPGNNLNILFQLAEATADSESEKEDVYWHYLDNNTWKPLRFGFEVLEDATDDLTTSGIVKFALPENMTNTNTVMPAGLHWMKATIPKNSKSVSETTGIHAQAIRVTFTNEAANDKLRLDKPIDAMQISKLADTDASVKKVEQPYETFGGVIPEEQQMFYVRVSELLRHKGRAIQKFDYERIVLEAFPEIFKAKCINHSFGLNAHLYENDFPYAPGYILLGAIPDLNKLKAGNAFEPKVPVSILEKIDAYVRNRTSAFVRFRSVNPRYEKIHFCLKVKLSFGKDENYYKEKLKEDIRGFLAPWAIGDYYKLTFAQCLNRSDIVRFIELLDYVDFILELNMRHDDDAFETVVSKIPVQICPRTPRSILIAGDIDVCIENKTCEDWEYCFEDNDKIRKDCCDKKEKIIDYCKPDVILKKKNG